MDKTAKVHLLDLWKGGRFFYYCGIRDTDPPKHPMTTKAEEVTCERCESARLGRVGMPERI